MIPNILIEGDISTPESALRFFNKAIEVNASEIHVTTEDFVRFEIQGRQQCVSSHQLDHEELANFVRATYKNTSGETRALGDIELDYNFLHRYQKEGDTRLRQYSFRVNVCSTTVSTGVGIHLAIRKVEEEVPEWHQLGLGEDLWNIWRPNDGIVIVSGPTGSGKSTLLAAGNRRILEERQNEKIVTLEHPVEYHLRKYMKESTMIVHRAIGKNTKSFMSGLESAMRQKPTIVIIGESRDRATIEAACTIATTGHVAYTTTHTNSVPETGTRLLSPFPAEEKEQRLADILYSSRLMINQRLLKSEDGKRVAVKEILPFDQDVRYRLESTNPRMLKKEMRRMVNEYGQPFTVDLDKYISQGLLREDDPEVKSIMLGSKAELN
ncbi:T2SP_E domain-containing protein [Vibrio chagasii]|nr:hypothetical protein AOG25_08710 [Vibrio alginolyticus]CAH7147479.1 T2SP_E domain-containing protein [Vibrio chagasii]CAH7318319.1 T2SP_E domain-containing protein [Vibrio chagasii]